MVLFHTKYTKTHNLIYKFKYNYPGIISPSFFLLSPPRLSETEKIKKDKLTVLLIRISCDLKLLLSCTCMCLCREHAYQTGKSLKV
jgi:hypothetical protein